MDWRESMKKDETPPPFPSHTNQKFTSVFLIPWKINISKLPKLVHVPTVSNLDILTVQVSFQTLPQLTKHIACSKAWLTGRNCDRIVFRNLPGGLIGCWKKRPLGTAAFFACSSMTKAVVATLPSLITVKKSLRLLVGQPWARQSWQIDFNTELSIIMMWPTNSRQGEGKKGCSCPENKLGDQTQSFLPTLLYCGSFGTGWMKWAAPQTFSVWSAGNYR